MTLNSEKINRRWTRMDADGISASSTGVYGFPMEPACKIAIAEVKKFFQQSNSLEQVIFVYFGQNAFDLYTKRMQEVSGN
ncbi:MAG: hypothetical protein KAF91_01105 [Nostoc sp. TH1S01]|nr:hypothetical protein [Nostoc sp. TH1S01]